MSPSGPKYTPLTGSDDEDYAAVASVDSDPNDIPADSETISSGEVIYTPSTASDNSIQKVYSDDETMTEEVSLISQSPPPRYQSPNGERTIADVKRDPEALGGDSPHNDFNGCGRGCRRMRGKRRGCCGRKPRREECRRRRESSGCCRALFVLVKIALVTSLFVWFFGGIIKRHCKHSFKHHGPDSQSHPFSRDREIVVNETYNSIWGSYPLYDLLSLSTTSGSIAVLVDPQPADPDDPLKPARLSLRSESGSIAVRFKLPWSPFDDDDTDFHIDGLEARAEGGDDDDLAKRHKKHKDRSSKRKDKLKKKCKGKWRQSRRCRAYGTSISPRPYEVEIHTTQGSISASIAFSSSAHISSESGSITARVVPLALPDPDYLAGKKVSLSTSVQSGSMYLHVAEPFFVKSDEDDDGSVPPSEDKSVVATASHVSEQSGSMVISYPGSWAGRVHASTAGSGSVRLKGPGLKVRKDGHNRAEGVKDPESQPEGKDWWGSSGRMDVSIHGEGSGSIKFRVRKQHRH